ncbi:hypothetical protein D0Y65_038445 [Glycine soja]|uniref:CCHC-type domain-containing protein n=1 Tax=Glycine soja TaxID=3848 RepID=A0A445H501_GLYSO|nr:hypothetical protein D0Y65_038445 [Glycine soja]
MVAYYEKLMASWDDLANYEQLSICTCKGCMCGVAAKLEKHREEEQGHILFMGLDDGLYGMICSNLLATNPMSYLNNMNSILVQEERLQTITRSKEERTKVMALTAQTSARMKGHENKNKYVCTNCNKSGHDEANCLLLIGYPKWWGDRPRNDDKAGGQGRGQNRTKGTGSNSEHAQKGPIHAHVVQNLGSNISGDMENFGMTGLSKEHM